MPGTALHDGAVIVQKERIAAAACFLPLTVNPAISSNLGTRHRAGIGITEETDCLALIVSEETGAISVGAFGVLERDVSIKRVDDRINEHFGVSRRGGQAPPTAPAARREDAVEAASRMLGR
jgi:diadenylate cyclase